MSTTVARVGGMFAIAIAALVASSVFHGHAEALGKTPFDKNEPLVLQQASKGLSASRTTRPAPGRRARRLLLEIDQV